MESNGRRAVVVIPTYNEAGNIERLLEGIRAAVDVEILVVDDSSPDGTADIVERFAQRCGGDITVLRRPVKSGLGTAYRAGFAEVLREGDRICVQMDA
ncbi:MAG: hypothetical protein RL726_285, partial [Actinomycetota bacterium]